LVGEPGGDRDLRERQIGFDQKVLDALDPALEQESVRWHARRLPERAREVGGRQADELRHHTVADVFRQMGEDILVDAPKVAPPQARASWQGDLAALGYSVQAHDVSALTTLPSKVVIAISQSAPETAIARGVFILVSVTEIRRLAPPELSLLVQSDYVTILLCNFCIIKRCAAYPGLRKSENGTEADRL